MTMTSNAKLCVNENITKSTVVAKFHNNITNKLTIKDVTTTLQLQMY